MRPLRSLAPTLIAGALAGSLILAGCTTSSSSNNGAGSPGTSGSGGGTTSAQPTTPPVSMSTNVSSAANLVEVDTRVVVKATDGTLTAVTLAYPDKKTKQPVNVPGTLSPDKHSWTAGDLLEPGVTYTVTMTGANVEGTANTQTSTFATRALTSKEQILPAVSPGNGETVGTAMPIIVTFDLPVPDKAAAEKLLTVTTVPATKGGWYWLSAREAHWRPQAYWAPGTKVTVDFPFNGVNVGKNAADQTMYGELSTSSTFTIGADVSASIDLAKHTLTLFNGATPVRTIPITGGKPASPTRSGLKVVMAKRSNFEMRAETLGLQPGDSEWYEPVHVAWALQMTHTGEFLHSAPWSVGDQGRRNVSHGCVGMSVSNSKWLYDNMKVGDLVRVTGSNKMMTMGNGIADWNLSWEQWLKGSAVPTS